MPKTRAGCKRKPSALTWGLINRCDYGKIYGMNIVKNMAWMVVAGVLTVVGVSAQSGLRRDTTSGTVAYRVTPAPRIGGAVRLREWHETVALPEMPAETVAAVRDAVTAERMSRLTSGLELRRADDASILMWAAREAVAETESRRRDRDVSGGGALDGWISDFATRQTRYGDQSLWDEALSGRAHAAPGRERSWGWLADDVLRSEHSQKGRYGVDDVGAYSDPVDAYDAFGGADGVRSGWHPGGAGRLHGSGAGEGGGLSFPVWR